MGLYDELYCDAELPDTAVPPGTCFQTKVFPEPFLEAIGASEALPYPGNMCKFNWLSG
jgi:hypothetical protein